MHFQVFTGALPMIPRICTELTVLPHFGHRLMTISIAEGVVILRGPEQPRQVLDYYLYG
jgi:hypothetical protein